MTIDIQPLGPPSWPDLQKLLSSNEKCRACGCMAWRVSAELRDFDAFKSLEHQVKAGGIHGALAYVDGEPVGWCNYGPRSQYYRIQVELTGRHSILGADPDEPWVVSCIFVRPDYRRRGMARALLMYVLASLRARGVSWVEGFPRRPGQLSASEALSGEGALYPLFIEQGFFSAPERIGDRVRVRMQLKFR